MKILIVDDQSANRIILRFQLEADGHVCLEANDGLEAIAQFECHQPELVLMDIMMPVMDGYESAEQIKAMSVGRHVPIIFLTAKTEQESLIQCLDYGDDYLVKPVSEILLKAKIQAHARTQDLTQQIQAKGEELTQLHETLKQEHEMGQHVLSHAMQRSWKECANVRSFLSPMSIFNGDLFLVAPHPNGGLYAFLGDMTGHGLSASIGAIPISQVFFTMCAKMRSVKEIIKELNATLKDFLPEYMFCAATLLQMNAEGDTVRIWSGGLPPIYVYRPGQGVVNTLPSTHVPLGILGDDALDSSVETIAFESGDRLLLMSDGILDVQNSSGELYGESGIDHALSQGHESSFEAVLADIKRFSKGVEQQDDISLVEIDLSPINQGQTVETLSYQSPPWQLEFVFEEEMLNDKDSLHQALDMLPTHSVFADARFRIQVILTELYSNALEHGLLKLESDLKDGAEGFEKYYQLRASRLASLESGRIEMRVAYQPGESGQEIFIEVKDSGEGYECSALNVCKPPSPDMASGRGLMLVDSLSHRVELTDGGSRVRAWLPLQSAGMVEEVNIS